MITIYVYNDTELKNYNNGCTNILPTLVDRITCGHIDKCISIFQEKYENGFRYTFDEI